MHYTINVTKHGIHMFATADHSLKTKSDAYAVFKLISNRFPESEGFFVTVKHWVTTSTRLQEENLK